MTLCAKMLPAELRKASLILVLCCLACHSSPYISNDVMANDEVGAVPGRLVSVPVKVYTETFRDGLKLGQCPSVMQEGKIKTCKDEFEGDEVYIAKGATTVDVKRVQTAEDILSHGMGAVGASVGVLGLASVGVKVKVAVTTETKRNALNLMSSYSMSTGVITLHNPRPKHLESRDGTLFLSELELGGDELLLVTLEFESEKQKVEVEVAIKIKILFISITAKLNYINENFKSKASCRVQFKSSWRKDITEFHSDLENCIPKVKKIEDMYLSGPKELRAMDSNDERLHYVYHFSSWKQSPYGMQFNLALINHDLEFLTEQSTEIKAVIERINKLKQQKWPSEVKKQVVQLNETLSDISKQLSDGLFNYHTLQPLERRKLRNVYGQNKPPQYYRRYFEKIIAQTKL